MKITHEQLQQAANAKEQLNYPYTENTPDTWSQGYYEAYVEVFSAINALPKGFTYKGEIKTHIFETIGADAEFRKLIDKGAK